MKESILQYFHKGAVIVGYVSARFMKVRLNWEEKPNGISLLVAHAPTESRKSVGD